MTITEVPTHTDRELAIQFATILRTIERTTHEPEFTLQDVVHMMTDYRMGLSDDAIELLDSDEVTDFVDEAFAYADQQILLEDLLTKIFGHEVGDITSFLQGFGEGR